MARTHARCWTFVVRSLENGISVVTINYRLIPDAQAEKIDPPVKACLDDAARALQFLRSKAAEWHLDKTRIAGSGGSAGGFTSLWLAFHPDQADAQSADPIARESTRLTCVLASVPQTSLMQPISHGMGLIPRGMGRFWRAMGAISRAVGFAPRRRGFTPQRGRALLRRAGFISRGGKLIPQSAGFIPRRGKSCWRRAGFIPQRMGLTPQRGKSPPRRGRTIPCGAGSAFFAA